ncbi:hypothetical protein EPN18_07390 [bacterium]|nr:MAG: hypothetical protein EPN18_07390 [bacterium]
MSTQIDIRNKVIAIVKDDSAKLATPGDYDQHIAAAINLYSRHRQGVNVTDVVGNGTHDYSLPAGWNDEFSIIESIEYPVGNVPASLIENDGYEVYQSPTGKKIRLKNDVPSAAQTFRIKFTILRAATTIPDGDVDAFTWLASALCLEALANIYAQTSDSTLAADAVNYRTKAQEFGGRAKSLMKLYKEHMGLKDNDLTTPASVITDLDVGYPGGRDRLTHPRWMRESR